MPKLENFRKLTVIFLIIMIFSLTGCTNNKIEDDNKKEKINQEMSYLDTKIITMLNRLNNISFSTYKVVSEDIKEETSGITNGNEKNSSNQEKLPEDTGESSDSKEKEAGDSNNKESESSEKEEQGNNDIKKSGSNSKDSSEETNSSSENKNQNSQIFKMTEEVLLVGENEENKKIEWEEIRKDIENIYTIWPTIALDLSNIGINNADLTEFSNTLDNLAESTKNKNKNTALVNLAKMYSLIPKYLEVYSDNNLNKKVMTTKSFILNSYAYADLEKWDEANQNLKMADNVFLSIVAQKSDFTNRELNINRSGILLNDLKNSIDKKDKQIFFVRYKNLLQELNAI